MQKRKNSLRDFWGNIKYTNIHIMGHQEKRESKELKNYFKK